MICKKFMEVFLIIGDDDLANPLMLIRNVPSGVTNKNLVTSKKNIMNLVFRLSIGWVIFTHICLGS